MPAFRLALANVPFAATADESVVLAQRAIGDASAAGAELVCFPESYVPGYRAPGRPARAAGRRVPRARLVIDCRGRCQGQCRRHPRHRAARGRRAPDHRIGDQQRRQPGGVPGQGSDRSVRGDHLHVRRRAACLPVRCADLRHRDLPRRVAVSGNRALGRKARRANRVPSARSRRRSLAATVP